MRKLFLNLFFFITPIVILVLIKQVFYVQSGDLGRLSKTIVSKEYREFESKIISEYGSKHKLKFLTEIKDKSTKNKTRILIIGDSFSNGQGNYGYVNQLAEVKEFEVVLYQNLLRERIEKNPTLALSGLINGGYFNNFEFDYVILQNVERYYLQRSDIDIEFYTINHDSIEYKIRKPINSKSNNLREKVSYELNDFILFYQYNFSYLLNKRAFDSDVYKFPISKSPFSYGNELLVYYQDLVERKLSPSTKDLTKSVAVINQLSNKLKESNTKLISIIAPDKYDMYYSFINEKEKLPKPTFFKRYNSITKKHIELNCYKILSEAIYSNIKDIYFYDNTHWSPFGHELISNNLEALIKKRMHNNKDSKFGSAGRY